MDQLEGHAGLGGGEARGAPAAEAGEVLKKKKREFFLFFLSFFLRVREEVEREEEHTFFPPRFPPFSGLISSHAFSSSPASGAFFFLALE